MKYAAACLSFAALAAAHGYVDNATIGGEEYTFYQPYLDPYMDPAVRQAPKVAQITTIVTPTLQSRSVSPAQFKAMVLSPTCR